MNSLNAPLSIFKIQKCLSDKNQRLLIYNEDKTIEFLAYAYEVTGVFSRDLMSLFKTPKIYVYANTCNSRLCIHGQAEEQSW